MADLRGVIIEEGAQGANTLDNGDAISGMIIAAPVAPGIALDTPKVVYNINDVKALGIDAAYDAANFVNAYRHLSEFYRMGGEGVKLHLMLVAKATTLSGVFTESEADAADSPAHKLIIAAGGEIRKLAVAVNPSAAPVVLDGFTTELYSAIPKAQGVAEWAEDRGMDLNILLEGYSYGGSSATVQGVKDIPDVSAYKVSVVIGQDWKYAESLPTVDGANPLFLQNFADVGTALGTAAAALVNQSIGDNSAFNLTDATRDAWMIPGLSNHTKIEDNYTSLQTLENKGFIFGLTYTGLNGVRWNNDYTCVETIVDAEGNINQHTIAYGQVMGKARRQLRVAYVLELKRTHPVDPTTGKLPPGVVKYFEGVGQGRLNDMLLRNEISRGEVTVDPNSDLVVEKTLRLQKIKVVPFGYANTITGTINLKSRL